MDISSIIYAAIGGGLGGGIGALIGKAFANKKDGAVKNIGIIVSIIAMVGMWHLTVGLYKNMVLPRIVPIDTAELFTVFPVMEHIKKEDNETYKELLYPLDKMTRNRNFDEASLADFRTKLDLILIDKKKNASAQTLREEQRLAAEQFTVLKEKAPEVCTQKSQGLPFKVLAGILGDDYGRRERAHMASLFSAAPRPSDYTPNLKSGEATNLKIAKKYISQLKITNVNPPVTETMDNIEDHKKICDFLIQYNTDSAALSDTDLLDLISYSNSLVAP